MITLNKTVLGVGVMGLMLSGITHAADSVTLNFSGAVAASTCSIENNGQASYNLGIFASPSTALAGATQATLVPEINGLAFKCTDVANVKVMVTGSTITGSNGASSDPSVFNSNPTADYGMQLFYNTTALTSGTGVTITPTPTADTETLLPLKTLWIQKTAGAMPAGPFAAQVVVSVINA